jgi:hypothetical protein
MLNIINNAKEVKAMQANVISLNEYKYKNNVDYFMSYDIIYIPVKKRNIRQAMIKGYMELLTKQINK